MPEAHRDAALAESGTRLGVAKVEHPGLYSALPETRRILVRMDSPMTMPSSNGTGAIEQIKLYA